MRDVHVILITLGLLGAGRISLAAPVNVSRGTWSGGFEIHVFEVGQADSQLIVFPSGYSMLIDAGEPSWNTCKGATAVAEKVIKVLGHNRINVGSPSHWHVDHLGYAGYGGFWCLIENELLIFDKILDRDGGVYKPSMTANKSINEECDEDHIEWHNAGTIGGTAVKWICYATDPQNEKIYSIREIAEYKSSSQITPPDSGASVTVVATDGYGGVLIDGKTPVSGNHVNDKTPPSENDYCIGFLIRFGDFTYSTGGDLDGEYATSRFGYTYNDLETPMGHLTHEVDVLHVNHHGSSHSSNEEFVKRLLKPSVSVISCGYNNSHGHPAQSTLDRILSISDVYLAHECDLERNYGASKFVGDDILIESHDYGKTFFIGEKQYPSNQRQSVA